MKGLATKTIGELIIMVIIVIILGAASVAALPYIKNLLAQYFGAYTDNPFTEAVDCSYLRCVNGCTGKVPSNEWPQLGSGADVKTQICPCVDVPSELKSGNKVCGFNGAQYPVEVNLGASAPLSATSFADGVDCVLEWGVDKLPGTFTNFKNPWNWLLIDTGALSDRGSHVDCTALAGSTLKNFIVSTKTLYVWTDKFDCGIFNAPTKQCYYTYVSSTPYYTLLTPDQSSATLQFNAPFLSGLYEFFGQHPISPILILIRVQDKSNSKDQRFLATSDGNTMTIINPVTGASIHFSSTGYDTISGIKFGVTFNGNYKFTVTYAGQAPQAQKIPVQFANIQASIFKLSGIVDLQGAIVPQNNNQLISSSGQLTAFKIIYYKSEIYAEAGNGPIDSPIDQQINLINGKFQTTLQYPANSIACSVDLRYGGDNTYGSVEQTIPLTNRDSRCT